MADNRSSNFANLGTSWWPPQIHAWMHLDTVLWCNLGFLTMFCISQDATKITIIRERSIGDREGTWGPVYTCRLTHSLARSRRESKCKRLAMGFCSVISKRGSTSVFMMPQNPIAETRARDAAQFVPDTTSKTSYLPLRESRTGTLSSCSCGEFCLLFTLSWSLSTSTDIRQGTHDRRRRRLLHVLLAPWRTNAPLAL